MITKFSGKDIPGMIEPIEQTTLEKLASNISFHPNDIVVEFGTFFGRSTACIAAGLSANPSFKHGGKFFAFDSFSCDLNGGFYPHVLNFASAHGVAHFLKYKDNKVNFFEIFYYFVNSYIEEGIIHPIEKEIVESMPPDGEISLMHIDSPKFYEEFKVILFRFFPHLRKGGLIVFQDFFYYWSASLIAACAYMVERGFISIIASSASSLICRVDRVFDFEGIQEMDLTMQKESEVGRLIDLASSLVDSIIIDRPEQFVPRLKLAKMQWLFEKGKHESAVNEITSFFKGGGKVNSALLTDFLDMMRAGFSTRKLYEKDHA